MALEPRKLLQERSAEGIDEEASDERLPVDTRIADLTSPRSGPPGEDRRIYTDPRLIGVAEAMTLLPELPLNSNQKAVP